MDYTQDSLGIALNAPFLQRQPHPAAAIRAKAALSLFRDDFCKNRVFLRPARTMDEVIVSTTGYLKETPHTIPKTFSFPLQIFGGKPLTVKSRFNDTDFRYFAVTSFRKKTVRNLTLQCIEV